MHLKDHAENEPIQSTPTPSAIQVPRRFTKIWIFELQRLQVFVTGLNTDDVKIDFGLRQQIFGFGPCVEAIHHRVIFAQPFKPVAGLVEANVKKNPPVWMDFGRYLYRLQSQNKRRENCEHACREDNSIFEKLTHFSWLTVLPFIFQENRTTSMKSIK